MDGTTGSVPSTASSSEYGSRTRLPLPIPLPLHSYIWRKSIELLLEIARRFALTINPICGVRLFDDIHGPGFIYREESIGFWERVLCFFGILNAESVRQLHWNINCWTDKQFFTWKKTYVANCIAVAVAASIFATVGLSALSLPNMDRMHWIVHALFSCSMLLGICAVYFATSVQQTVGLLNNPFYLRLWLSRGLPHPRILKEPHTHFPLDASVSALRLLQLRQRLLGYSVLLFLVGYSLYLLFSWKYDSGHLGSDYRNAFFSLMAVLGAGLLDYIITSVCLLFDAHKRYSEFGIGSQSFHQSAIQHKLEQSFTGLQRVLASGMEGTVLPMTDLDKIAAMVKDIDDLVKERLKRATESPKPQRETVPSCRV